MTAVHRMGDPARCGHRSGAAPSYGLTCERRRCGRRQVLFCGEEPWPSYTERAASLVARIWPQQKLPYAVLSAAIYGELLGLQRNLVRSLPGTRGLRVASNPGTAMCLWQDTYLVIGALAFTADRAAAFLGLNNQLTARHATARSRQAGTSFESQATQGRPAGREAGSPDRPNTPAQFNGIPPGGAGWCESQ